MSDRQQDRVEQPDPTEDPCACSRCGVFLGTFPTDEYCDGCAREIGVKQPLRRCENCGRRGPEEDMTAVNISPENEYYPEFVYLCPACSGGGSA